MSDFMLREIERAIREAEHPAGWGTHDGKARVSADLLRRLLAENEALRADAERYRLWRSDHTDAASDSDTVSPMLMALADAWTPEEVDAAIDAARSKT